MGLRRLFLMRFKWGYSLMSTGPWENSPARKWDEYHAATR